MVQSGAIDVAPQFQRRDRWGTDQQSALVESFLMNIPVPPVYLAEESLGRYAVIDGKQRITAVSDYLTGKFPLRGLREIPGINGLRAESLPPEMLRTLEMRPLRAVALLRQSADHLKYVVFHRLNTGGEVLNAQELRNVVFRGPLNDLVYELAGNAFFLRQIKAQDSKSPAYKNMQDADWVLRFLTLSEEWQAFSGDLSRSMDDFMARNQFAAPEKLHELRERFDHAIATCELLWGDLSFKRPVGAGWRDQALAGMFDAQMVSVAELGPRRLARLAGTEKPARIVAALFKSSRFDEAVRQATNTPSRVQYRISELKAALLAAVGLS
ncbi:DUF262 domain-containing protein [Blastococcus sp. TBT05-19]|nr:DUF262 domain-containing protein [Blastococcus sp. TBT05-19]